MYVTRLRVLILRVVLEEEMVKFSDRLATCIYMFMYMCTHNVYTCIKLIMMLYIGWIMHDLLPQVKIAMCQLLLKQHCSFIPCCYCNSHMHAHAYMLYVYM